MQKGWLHPQHHVRWLWWYTAESLALRRWRQEHPKFKAILTYMRDLKPPQKKEERGRSWEDNSE